MKKSRLREMNHLRTKQLVSFRVRLWMEVGLTRVLVADVIGAPPIPPWPTRRVPADDPPHTHLWGPLQSAPTHPPGRSPAKSLPLCPQASWISLREGLLWLLAPTWPVHRDLIHRSDTQPVRTRIGKWKGQLPHPSLRWFWGMLCKVSQRVPGRN